MGQARTAQQCSWEGVGAETYVCVDATWRPFGNGRRNKRPKIALPFLRAICFAEILWKFLGRTGSRATVGQLHGRTDWQTDRSAGTGCHVGDIWPNCALMCVCACVCHVCVCARANCQRQMATNVLYIFICCMCVDFWLLYNISFNAQLQQRRQKEPVCLPSLSPSLSFYIQLYPSLLP